MKFAISRTQSTLGGRFAARRGVLRATRGDIQKPIFMPVGTQATVKTVSPRDLNEANVQIILGNTYHLFLRPGNDIMAAAGGLHKFMSWDKPILTDSGGFQVFSLAKIRKIRDDGVEFASHISGAKSFMGPVESMATQRALGSDIAMCFDECIPYPATRAYAADSTSRTLRWAALCAEQPRAAGQSLFGIVQGGVHPELRAQCARGLADIGFDGYAIGGVSVGEPEAELLQGVEDSTPRLPEDKPRYLMGVGDRAQIIEAVARGIDMFDCVMPTRNARNGSAFTDSGTLQIKAARQKADFSPIEEGCPCACCRGFTRAYVRHLLNAGEIFGATLLTIHNITSCMRFMDRLRASIEAGDFAEFREENLARLRAPRAD